MNDAEQPDTERSSPQLYTRTGDTGETTLEDDTRTAKTDPRIAVRGECDEVAALIGVAITLATDMPVETVRLLTRVQNDIDDLSADIGAPIDGHAADEHPRIDEEYVARIERACDYFGAELSPIGHTIVPGGTTSAANLHHARTVVRRAERTTNAALAIDHTRMNPLTRNYLNRLASLLLILARLENLEHGDNVWQPGLSAELGGVELWEPVPDPAEA